MAGDGRNNVADLLVIFGVTGDLARNDLSRIVPAGAPGASGMSYSGRGGRTLSNEELVALARDAVSGRGEEIDENVFNRFTSRLSYVSGDVTGDSLYAQLAQQIGAYHRLLYYLETSPSLFGPIVEHLDKAELVTDARVAVEKPCGHDLRSTRELDARFHQALAEDQNLRVDHFLAKNRSWSWSTCGLPIWRWPRCGPQEYLGSADHSGRRLRRGRPQPALRPGGRSARRRANHLLQAVCAAGRVHGRVSDPGEGRWHGI